MKAFILSCVVFLTLVAGTAAADVPTSFGCRNSLLSDEWRAMVLNFHNEKRRTVSRGDQLNKDGNKLPPARKMNELTWDCNMERIATNEVAKCADYTNNKLGVNQETTPVTASCNITAVTETLLNKWWDEVTTSNAGLASNLKYTDDSGLKNFANMVFFNTNAFACDFYKCSNEGRLLCLYNKNLILFFFDFFKNINTMAGYFSGAEKDKQLYFKADSPSDACGKCDENTAPCVNRLCQPAFTLAAEDPLVCADDSMTNDMTNTALYMHNYYRSLLGTGWAEDKINMYAPLAVKMPQLKYGCADLGKEAAEKAKACEETPSEPTVATRSQNFLKIDDYKIDREEALKQAISTWWSDLANVGIGNDTTYTKTAADTLKYFPNMAFDQTTEVGCSVETCTRKGFTMVVCQYNMKISEGTKIYETGTKSCSGCANKKCGDLPGLCTP